MFFHLIEQLFQIVACVFLSQCISISLSSLFTLSISLCLCILSQFSLSQFLFFFVSLSQSPSFFIHSLVFFSFTHITTHPTIQDSNSTFFASLSNSISLLFSLPQFLFFFVSLSPSFSCICSLDIFLDFYLSESPSLSSYLPSRSIFCFLFLNLLSFFVSLS